MAVSQITCSMVQSVAVKKTPSNSNKFPELIAWSKKTTDKQAHLVCSWSRKSKISFKYDCAGMSFYFSWGIICLRCWDDGNAIYLKMCGYPATDLVYTKSDALLSNICLHRIQLDIDFLNILFVIFVPILHLVRSNILVTDLWLHCFSFLKIQYFLKKIWIRVGPQ